MDELFEKELVRKSNDMIAVFNPTMEDYYVIWDGYRHLVPNCNKDAGSGAGVKILPRYLAEKYVGEMTDKLMLRDAQIAIEKENDERVNKRKMKKMDAWEEQLAFERPLMVDNKEKRREIIKILWKGLVERYGMDGMAEIGGEKVDTRPLDEQLLEELERPYQPSVQESPATSATQSAAMEIAE